MFGRKPAIRSEPSSPGEKSSPISPTWARARIFTSPCSTASTTRTRGTAPYHRRAATGSPLFRTTSWTRPLSSRLTSSQRRQRSCTTAATVSRKWTHSSPRAGAEPCTRPRRHRDLDRDQLQCSAARRAGPRRAKWTPWRGGRGHRGALHRCRRWGAVHTVANVAIVVSVVLVGEVAAPERRGRSIGYFGLALSAPGIVVPSLGVALLEAGHVEVDALVAFGFGLVGALLVLSLPRAAAPMPRASTNLLSAFRRPGLLLIFAGFVMVSSSFGAVITFAPIALPATGIGSVAVFLFVAGAARAASRWAAGVLGDRRQGGLVLAASIGVTFVGLVALASHANEAVVVFAGVAFGAGYGAVQTTAYLAMSARGSSAHRNNVSALWNSGIDLGSSLGGTLLGLAAARFGYATAIWAIPAVVAIALPLFLVPVKPLPDTDSSGALVEAAAP